MTLKVLLAALFLSSSAHAQIQLQDSHTTASLRGIDTPAPGVAWASGSGGTVLRTVDGGVTWRPCTTPPGAEKLDFRGIQATDARTAVIMSSGKGDLSRLYKTTDACRTWTLVYTNPDPEGFFDTLRRIASRRFYVLGDPVHGRFAVFSSADAGETWAPTHDSGLEAEPGDGAFAASNTSFVRVGPELFFGTGGTGLPHVYRTTAYCPRDGEEGAICPSAWVRTDVPLASHSAAAGVFSLAGRTETNASGRLVSTLVAVGGIYDKPAETVGTAAFSRDGGRTWTASTRPPNGYRSAVAFDPVTRSWVAAGSTGADLSTDDGATWTPIPAGGQTGWNAIALPYLVGAKGRIARLAPAPSQR